jgi:hypothetical protein
VSREDSGGTDGADGKGGESISSNLRGRGVFKVDGRASLLLRRSGWQKKSRVSAYTVWETFLPKLQYGKESCPNYFTTGENLDHAQIMGALFLPYFWKHDRWRCNFLPIGQNMVDGIWTEIFNTGGDALNGFVALCHLHWYIGK